MIDKKHKGASAEMRAACWLLSQGYDVFRNVSQHGLADIIAVDFKTGEIILVDIKTGIASTGGKLRHVKVSDEQAKAGVRCLAVLDSWIGWPEDWRT